ncbi:hypothetical protein JGU66_24595 [Myxococcaceae bacterium JPH2]|nr:hypothetical protein [Myxococcaceae bacterium JPH2]
MRTLRTSLLALAVGLAVAGCAKHVDTRVAGDDDAALDAASSRLEELESRAHEDDLSCGDRCALAPETCAAAEHLCALAERNADRDDLPPRCAQAREQCANANDECARCQNG